MTGSGGGAMRWVPDWDQVPDWLGWLVAVLVAIVAIRATFRFDLNQWLRDRRQWAHSRFPGAVCKAKMDCEAGGG